MVRPSLISVVKLSIIRARSARQNFGPCYFLLFLAVRRRSYCTLASNWESKAWKFNHTERKSYARTYPAGFYYSNIQSGNEQDNNKRRTHNYIKSHLRLRMVWPWPDQPDRFRHLWIVLLNQNVADSAQVICEYLLYAEYTHTIIVLSD